eukprot:m51a1_g2221 hypothetical protein (170) ;mRNA; r:221065-221574
MSSRGNTPQSFCDCYPETVSCLMAQGCSQDDAIQDCRSSYKSATTSLPCSVEQACRVGGAGSSAAKKEDEDPCPSDDMKEGFSSFDGCMQGNTDNVHAMCSCYPDLISYLRRRNCSVLDQTVAACKSSHSMFNPGCGVQSMCNIKEANGGSSSALPAAVASVIALAGLI